MYYSIFSVGGFRIVLIWTQEYGFRLLKLFIEHNESPFDDKILRVNFPGILPGDSYLVRQLSTSWKRFVENGEALEFPEKFLFMDDLSDFSRKVLLALKGKVGFGEVISYKKLAELSGYNNASRAVGTVMKNNPFPGIIPCHRVILSNGNIGKFALGEIFKRELLRLEGVNVVKDIVVT